MVIFQIFPPASVILPELACSFQCVPSNIPRAGPFVTCHVSQAAKDVRASQKAQNTLLVIFERIEMFFRRLEVYTKVEPTPEKMDMMVEITVEILSILGIATKEIRQGGTSE